MPEIKSCPIKANELRSFTGLGKDLRCFRPCWTLHEEVAGDRQYWLTSFPLRGMRLLEGLLCSPNACQYFEQYTNM